jgi:hypothetical protein
MLYVVEFKTSSGWARSGNIDTEGEYTKAEAEKRAKKESKYMGIPYRAVPKGTAHKYLSKLQRIQDILNEEI